MSKGNLQQVMVRIKGSEVSSPMAVFRCDQPEYVCRAKTLEKDEGLR